MADHEFQFPAPACSNVAADIAKNSTIIEEGPRICPLCNSIVRLFYIHYTSKILMCENLKCEYPFGDDFTIYESDDDGYFLSELDLSSIKSKKGSQLGKGASRNRCTSTQGTSSELSTAEWSEINRLNQAYDSDDSLTSSKIFTKKSSQRRLEKRAKRQENEEKIKQNVEKIKELNKVLFSDEEKLNTIHNEKWLKNLSSMQSSSGVRLVNDQELQKLKKAERVPVGELKIDIEARQDSMSLIKIEIGNQLAKK
ncbi:uncharacterized protein LOC110377897 [Helicoverpa armigera]|uniref:uncharacterized protein LOC110377897 n=1 Tax=Helicoverpa armigera TaxID=29058 RepID=UPI002113292A|nr:uncharacterized protein LOC110377897 [Helicoverpa armigera]